MGGNAGMGGNSPMRGGVMSSSPAPLYSNSPSMGYTNGNSSFQANRGAYGNAGMSISSLQMGNPQTGFGGGMNSATSNSGKSNPDSFNFLQETMQRHLVAANTTAPSSGSSSGRAPPPNPFQM